MISENFTPLSALAGGALIGLSAVLLMLLNGRVAGVSGIAGRLLSWRTLPRSDAAWRVAFLVGLILGAALYGVIAPVTIQVPVSWPVLTLGGVMVGFGTQLGSGCTSGHGVCGVARLSPRSLVATLVFVASAIVAVYVSRHLIGSGP